MSDFISRHKAKYATPTAIKAVGVSTDTANAKANIPVEYEILKELAASEWASLKSVDRAIKKDTQARYLEKYRPFLDAYIANADSYPNTLLFYGLVWTEETDNFDPEIHFAEIIVQTGLRF